MWNDAAWSPSSSLLQGYSETSKNTCMTLLQSQLPNIASMYSPTRTFWCATYKISACAKVCVGESEPPQSLLSLGQDTLQVLRHGFTGFSSTASCPLDWLLLSCFIKSDILYQISNQIHTIALFILSVEHQDMFVLCYSFALLWV